MSSSTSIMSLCSWNMTHTFMTTLLLPLVSHPYRFFVVEITDSRLVHIRENLPNFLVPLYDVLCDTLLSGFRIIGIEKGSSTATSGGHGHDRLCVYSIVS